MKRNTRVARVTQTDAGAERINNLEKALALAPVSSRRRRTLSTAIRIEADAYRKALDTEQATATHDAKPQPTAGLGSLKRTPALRKRALVRQDTIHRRSRSAPKR